MEGSSCNPLTVGSTILCKFLKKKFGSNSAIVGQHSASCQLYEVFFCLQMAQPLIAKVLWDDIMKYFPEALGDENPNNQRIEKLFGNQGGY
jgi:hypothetical protein